MPVFKYGNAQQACARFEGGFPARRSWDLSKDSSSSIVIPITTASTHLSAKPLRLSLHPLL